MNIDSDIEAIRLAALKTLEFLLDTLGCSLGESLVQIFVTIIRTYPSMQTALQSDKMKSEIASFFNEQWQPMQNGLVDQSKKSIMA